ncbi:MAG TPA: hypothetical protein VJC03_05020, partial [bacterium]|nr:hypothetical protein [bacterium]
RLISLFLFGVLLVSGLVQAWKNAGIRTEVLFALLTLAYTYAITSLSVGYDRYRIPLHPLMWPFIAHAVLASVPGFLPLLRGKKTGEPVIDRELL